LLRDAGAVVATIDRQRLEVPPVRGLHLVADVSNRASLHTAIEEIEGAYGRCDILVTSAGVAPVGNAARCSESQWNEAFDVNARGTWLTFVECLPLMGAGASVVTIASAAGLRPLHELAAYAASKAAVISLTRSIAIDYADHGIRANCICPGVIDTPLSREAQRGRSAEEREVVATLRNYPMKRPGLASEVAEAVLFLGSPSASYITGTTLPVDGGRCLH
jgi:NAD(P)-dependent dehydrogenase (short-subunit alcohol dehydrogenase family)